VGIILCFSVVARMNMTCFGGSSRVLRNALNAPDDSMCTSSTINTLYLPFAGGTCTWSTSSRIASTPLFEAASSSSIFNEVPALNALQEGHSLQASPSGVRCSQFMVLAKIRAQEVLPTPLDPQNR
jgi:hypothetical protein